MAVKLVNGNIIVQGDYSYHNVQELEKPLVALLQAAKISVTIDLSKVGRCDSSLLALLLLALSEGSKLGIIISFINMPSELLAMAKLANVQDYLK